MPHTGAGAGGRTQHLGRGQRVLFGSESGCLDWQGGYRLHDLKQAFAPFSAFFFLSRLCVPWGQNLLLYLYSFPQYPGKIVSNPQKTANELGVVRMRE